jgi:hypothetical protein
MSNFFLKNPNFPPNGLILKGIIGQFLMAEFQLETQSVNAVDSSFSEWYFFTESECALQINERHPIRSQVKNWGSLRDSFPQHID